MGVRGHQPHGAKPEKLASPMLMPIFDKKAQWQKKPNNMKNVERKKKAIK